MSILSKILDILIIMKIIFLCAIECKKINFFNIKRPRRDLGPQRCNSMWIPSLFFANLLMAKNHSSCMVIYHLVKYSDSMNIGFEKGLQYECFGIF
jgi:hypothetical protein